MAFRRLLDRLSLRAVSERLDRRKMQQEIDAHRLFLLCSHHRQTSQGGSPRTEEIISEADKLDFEELAHSVRLNLQGQLQHIAQVVHQSLLDAGDPAQAASLLTEIDAAAAARKAASDEGQDPSLAGSQPATARRGRGLAAAVGAPLTRTSAKAPKPQQQTSEQQRPHQAAQVTSMHALAEAVEDRLGFAVHKAPSAIPHDQAGDGLWLSGKAAAGSVVAIYPGISYEHQHYRYIPGYPRVDRGNDTLLARYDGALINALPWAALQQAAASASASALVQNAPHPGNSADAIEDGGPAVQQAVHSAPSQQQPWQTQLEVRHPLALAHVANHPPDGTKPNVMVAPYDFSIPAGEPPWLRAYIPCIAFQPRDGADSSPSLPLIFARNRQQSGASSQDSTAHLAIQDARAPVKGIAFVATREVHNEELLLNYRLSPHVSRPEWYTPVDAEEDQRRWG